MTYMMVRRWGLMVAALALLLDVVSKGEILRALAAGKLPWWLVENQLGFAFAWNRGMSFSLLQDAVWGPWVLSAVAVVACVWFVQWMGEDEERGTRNEEREGHQVVPGLIAFAAIGDLIDRVVAFMSFLQRVGDEERGARNEEREWHQMGLGLIVGGAIGNLIDRLVHGAVVDFIVMSPAQLFPFTFNVADACITLGVGVLLLDGLFKKKGTAE